MGTTKTREEIPPDFDDPFRPGLSSTRKVKCIHCDRTYEEKEIRWGYRYGSWLWWCKHAGCDGAGFGFDIHPVEGPGQFGDGSNRERGPD
jgi:hypothetical protein